jgi:Cu(I)/Ag(I) efflux system membrane fusion protein
MKRSVTWVLSIALAVVVGAGIGYLASNRGTNSQETVSPAGEGKAVAPSDRKVLYWHDPMVPGQKFDKPGKSPFMDMRSFRSMPTKPQVAASRYARNDEQFGDSHGRGT